MRTELLVRGVTELEKTYTIVQDLDSLRSNYDTRSFDSKSSVTRTSSSSQFNKSSTQSFSHKNNFKGKQSDDHSKPSKQSFSKFSAFAKCYRCQDYGHIASNCPSEMKITFISRVPTKLPRLMMRKLHITQI